MENILSDLDTASLVNAIKSNLNGFFKNLKNSSVAHTKIEGNDFYWRTPIPHPWFNGVLSDENPKDMSTVIDQALSFFESNHVPTFTWWLAPHLNIKDWSKSLEPKGFSLVKAPPGMAIDLSNLPLQNNHQGTIEIVQDNDKLSEWTKTFTIGYGIPESMSQPFFELFADMGTDLPLRHYLYRLDGKPVGTSSLFLDAGVAGIYNVATLPEARGKGIGSLMTLIPLYYARELGFRAGILQSSEMGFSVYQKLGFKKLCDVTHFNWQSENGS